VIAKAKEVQGYDPKPEPAVCSKCKHFTSERTERIGWDSRTYVDEKKLRCGIGGFAIKKMGSCNLFERALATLREGA